MSDLRVEEKDPWELDEAIEQTEYMARVWERQAEGAEGTPSAELIKSVARGYALQLAALLEARGTRPGQSFDPLRTFSSLGRSRNTPD